MVERQNWDRLQRISRTVIMQGGDCFLHWEWRRHRRTTARNLGQAAEILIVWFFLYFNETKLKPETKKAIISRDYVYTFEENKTSISTNGSPYAQKHFRTRPVRPECHWPRVPSPTGLEHTGSCSPLFYVCTIGILWPIIGHVWC